MIALIDDGDLNRRAGQSMCNLETTEAGADDDDMMAVRWIAQYSVVFSLNFEGNSRRNVRYSSLHFLYPGRSHRSSARTLPGADYMFAEQNRFIPGHFEKHREDISRIACV